MTGPLDLDQVTLVNESRAETEPGDVSVFRTPQAACAYLVKKKFACYAIAE